MQQTEKYQFDLIEGSDPFSARPLNENMEKVEAALTAQQADTAAQFAALPRFHIMTWTGTGTNRRTLTFPFQPKAMFLFSPVGDSLPPMAVEYGRAYGYRSAMYNSSRFCDLTWNGNSVTMSDREDGGSGAFNGKDAAYLALAIG